MKQPLSPAAAAAWEAFNEVAERVGVLEDYGDALAAALRAVADQVVPEDFCAEVLYWSSDDYEKGQEIHNSEIRSQLLTIAAELEGKR